MVGRERELGVLTGIWERVVDEGRAHFVTVLGPAGIGKSRIALELAQLVADQGARVIRGRCTPYGASSPYSAFAQQVKQTAQIFDSDERHRGGGEARRPRSPRSPARARRRSTRRISRFFSGSGTNGEVADREQLFFSARVLVESLALRSPTLLLYDDIHWADASLLDLLETLAARVRDVPVLFVALARPELLTGGPAGAAAPAYTALPLEPLPDALVASSPSSSAVAHDGRSGGRRRRATRSSSRSSRGPRRATGDRARRATDEHPRSSQRRARRATPTNDASASARVGHRPHRRGQPALHRGVVRVTLGKVHGGREPSADERPRDHRARLDSLPPSARSRRRSVVGRVFWRGALRRSQTGRPPALLGSLEARDLIQREAVSRIKGDQQFAFKHGLIHDVAYETLPRAARTERHAAVARFLEATTTSGSRTRRSRHHWREAGETERAVEHLTAAARPGRAWLGEARAVVALPRGARAPGGGRRSASRHHARARGRSPGRVPPPRTSAGCAQEPS